ncbi:MAG: universal stress protein [Bacteroidota bacterium]
MKRLLVPTDFSKEAEHALDVAADLCKKMEHAEILLLHVMEVPFGSFSVMGEVHTDYAFEQVYQVKLIEKTKSRLAELENATKEKGVTVVSKMEFGNAFENIATAITDQQVDMVVMGSKGASGLAEVFIGSNAERVIRNASCPVLTVKGPTSILEIKSLVLATDTTPEQEPVVEKVKALQELLGLNIHVVRVITPYNFLAKGHALQQLKDFATKVQLEDYTLDTIEAEFADEGIIAFAEKHNIGLVAMGTHGRKGLAHFFGGSTAEDVANHSKIPIWTMKMPGV